MRTNAIRLILFLQMALVASNAARSAERQYRDLFSDTWVGTDAIGRTMPDATEVGPVKTDRRRTVGIFYVTWHQDAMAKRPGPYRADVSCVLSKSPSARSDAQDPAWGESPGFYHWGEPELGYFLSRDRFVIRKDLSMLADAGIDVLIMDVTNAARYWDEWDTLFTEMERMAAEGNKVPKICFWAFNGPVITVVQDIYEKIYKPGKYKDLWFYWDDKPLLLYNAVPQPIDSNGARVKNPNPHYDAKAKTDAGNPHYGDPDYCEEYYKDYTREVRGYFTLRTMWGGSFELAGKRFVGTEDNWSFCYELHDPRVAALTPSQLLSTHKGVGEEFAVTPAQHPHTVVGKSWSREHGEPPLDAHDMPGAAHVPWLGRTAERPEGFGIYFQQRWDEALKADPQFLYLNDWNEWTAIRWTVEMWNQLTGCADRACAAKSLKFMRRDNPFWFIDQYNAEFNRTIQPMKGGYTDNYYMQMAANIRRYKGVRPIPKLHGNATIRIDGDFADWSPMEVEYRDTVGDTIHRDYDGYGGLHYTDDSGRNDIATCKVAVDDAFVYFYAETSSPMTPHTDHNWMLLLLDSDNNPQTGWHGYDHLVNKHVIDDRTTTLMRYESDVPGGRWVEQARLDYRCAGNRLEVAVPRNLFAGDGANLRFDFHWCDNPRDLNDPISLCIGGDSAPNRRFNYRCIWSNK